MFGLGSRKRESDPGGHALLTRAARPVWIGSAAAGIRAAPACSLWRSGSGLAWATAPRKPAACLRDSVSGTTALLHRRRAQAFGCRRRVPASAQDKRAAAGGKESPTFRRWRRDTGLSPSAQRNPPHALCPAHAAAPSARAQIDGRRVEGG